MLVFRVQKSEDEITSVQTLSQEELEKDLYFYILAGKYKTINTKKHNIIFP